MTTHRPKGHDIHNNRALQGACVLKCSHPPGESQFMRRVGLQLGQCLAQYAQPCFSLRLQDEI